jgi:hypothetical protein
MLPLFIVLHLIHAFNITDVNSVALGQSALAVASGSGAYVFSLNGETLWGSRGRFYSVSYCCGYFVFSDGSKMYVVSEDGTLLNKFKVGDQLPFVRLLGSYVVGCGPCCCEAYDLRGNYVDGVYLNSPCVSEPSIIALYNLIIVPEKKYVEAFRVPSMRDVWDVSEGSQAVATCSNKLLLADGNVLKFYVVKESGPVEVWERTLKSDADALAFSPDCSWIAVAHGSQLSFFSLNGIPMNSVKMNGAITSLEWRGKFLVVGFENGVALFEARPSCRTVTLTRTVIETTTVTTTVYTNVLLVTIIK